VILASILALMAGAAAVALGWPLLRRSAAAPSRADFDRAIYRDQLAEIERDTERGLIGAEEAAAARAEIERRALAALDSDAADTARPASRGLRALALALIVALPALSGAVYLFTGAPGLPGVPFAGRPAAPAAKMPGPETLAAMGKMIEARLAESPDEAQGWALLVRLYRRLDRAGEAEALFRSLLAKATDPKRRAAIAIAYGEAWLAAENGTITPAARAAFDAALAAEPGNPGARFYRGLALAQAGEHAAALAIWQELERASPPDAPWLESLRGNIEKLTKEAGERR
jgi:cytochrome c-type biogenesis protein CcmH